MNFGGAVRLNKLTISLICGIAFLFILYMYGGSSTENRLPSASSSYGKLKRQVSLRQILIAAIDVAERGGQEVVRVRYGNSLGEAIKGETKEGAKDRVTQGDFNSHRVMFYGMRKAFPGIKVISEEHDENPTGAADVPYPRETNDVVDKFFRSGDNADKSDLVNTEDVVVWIDPLDATQEYTENLVSYVTTMVGVAVKGRSVLGVIHKPFSLETFWAVEGHGVSPSIVKLLQKKGEKPQNSKPEDLKVVVSRSHAGTVKNLTEHALASIGIKPEILTSAGAGYKVLEVINGNADAYVHATHIKKWDLCAGNGILNALSGSMTTLAGEPIDYSPETDPKNTGGILAYLSLSEEIKKRFYTIQIPA